MDGKLFISVNFVSVKKCDQRIEKKINRIANNQVQTLGNLKMKSPGGKKLNECQ